jgi:hypothetical protein
VVVLALSAISTAATAHDVPENFMCRVVGPEVWERGDDGDADAQAAVADMVAHCPPVDQASATAWYLRAARQGHARAQFIVARRYWIGHGTAVDDGEAYFWSMVFLLDADSGAPRVKHAKATMEDARSALTHVQRQSIDRRIAAWVPVRER